MPNFIYEGNPSSGREVRRKAICRVFGSGLFIILCYKFAQEGNVLVVGTAGDFESRSNSNVPFKFMDHKDGTDVLIVSNFNLPERHYSRIRLIISGCVCALRVSAEADKEGLIAVAKRNGGIAGTGIKFVYSKEIENYVRIPRCTRGSVVLQAEPSKSVRIDPSSAAQF